MAALLIREEEIQCFQKEGYTHGLDNSLGYNPYSYELDYTGNDLDVLFKDFSSCSPNFSSLRYSCLVCEQLFSLWTECLMHMENVHHVEASNQSGELKIFSSKMRALSYNQKNKQFIKPRIQELRLKTHQIISSTFVKYRNNKERRQSRAILKEFVKFNLLVYYGCIQFEALGFGRFEEFVNKYKINFFKLSNKKRKQERTMLEKLELSCYF